MILRKENKMKKIVRVFTQYIENYNHDNDTIYEGVYKFKGGDEYHIAVNINDNHMADRRALAKAVVFVNTYFCNSNKFNPTIISDYEVIDINTKGNLEDSYLESNDIQDIMRINLEDYECASSEVRKKLEQYISIETFKKILD